MSLLAQASGPYSASRATAGDVSLIDILSVPPTTPSTSQPAFLVVRVASASVGSGNGTFSGISAYHVDFIPADGSAPFGMTALPDSFNGFGTSQYAFDLCYQSDARVQVGGTLTLTVTLDPAAPSGYPWHSQAGTSDQGVISALVLDPVVGVGNDARLFNGTTQGTNSGTSDSFPVSTKSGVGRLWVWQHASVNTSSPTLSGFTSVSMTQSGSTMTRSANNATVLFATTVETAPETLTPTWSWIGSSPSYDAALYVDNTVHQAPPGPYAPMNQRGRSYAQVIGG